MKKSTIFRSALFCLLMCGLPHSWAEESSLGDYWRFEDGAKGAVIQATRDIVGGIDAVSAKGPATTYTDDMPMALIPQSSQANHGSLIFTGGWLHAKSALR